MHTDEVPTLLSRPSGENNSNKITIYYQLSRKNTYCQKADLQGNTTNLEAKIDPLMYELHGLTEEEIGIVKELFICYANHDGE
ncbi:MAG: hypothetical protein GXO91_04065 [FCB group bacterium]|nr:hypothetical protein [FCB group bacterium]